MKISLFTFKQTLKVGDLTEGNRLGKIRSRSIDIEEKNQETNNVELSEND